LPRFKFDDAARLSNQELQAYGTSFVQKLAWFMTRPEPYKPHYYQTLFHSLHPHGRRETLCRFRHLVAGRRGGKTLSAAWELVYYVLHPEEFHRDAHGIESSRPLHGWVLTKDYPTGMAALMAFREVLKAAGMVHGTEYKENRGNRWFEFENGGFIQFKTADEPESLRGAGLDVLWIDEAAFITDERPWQVVRPALSDKLGLVVTTTTPSGKNWFYDEFWGEKALEDPEQGRVEYRSIDNPYFPAEEWLRAKQEMHPLIFKQEYMASFDSMAGKELPGDWLKYWSDTYYSPPKDPTKPTGYDLQLYLGVDPAISLADTADRFSMALIGVQKDTRQVYLIEQYAGRIPFPEQVELIAEWHQLYRPRYIGIEKNAYQAALAQTVVRHPSFPPVLPIWTKGKKPERILSMSPYFKLGRVRIKADHKDFINEWIDYDSELKNPKDDCLDAVEIAMRAAGILLPEKGSSDPNFFLPAGDIYEMARQDYPSTKRADEGVDEHLGAEW
jgi:predicted phage terminase large subunit-like protein